MSGCDMKDLDRTTSSSLRHVFKKSTKKYPFSTLRHRLNNSIATGISTKSDKTSTPTHSGKTEEHSPLRALSPEEKSIPSTDNNQVSSSLVQQTTTSSSVDLKQPNFLPISRADSALMTRVEEGAKSNNHANIQFDHLSANYLKLLSALPQLQQTPLATKQPCQLQGQVVTLNLTPVNGAGLQVCPIYLTNNGQVIQNLPTAVNLLNAAAISSKNNQESALLSALLANNNQSIVLPVNQQNSSTPCLNVQTLNQLQASLNAANQLAAAQQLLSQLPNLLPSLQSAATAANTPSKPHEEEERQLDNKQAGSSCSNSSSATNSPLRQPAGSSDDLVANCVVSNEVNDDVNDSSVSSSKQLQPDDDGSVDDHLESSLEKFDRKRYPKRRRQVKYTNHKFLNDRALTIMQKWYENHVHHPYPSMEDKERLAVEGGISAAQVSSWFANRRTRSSNTRPKNKLKLLLQRIHDYSLELESKTGGLIDAQQVELHLTDLVTAYLD